MKSNLNRIVVASAIMLMIGTAFFSASYAAVEIDSYPNYSPGDYFEYDLNATPMMKSMMSSMLGKNLNLSISAESAKLRFTGTEDVSLNGTTYHCIVGEVQMKIKMSFSGEYMGISYTGNAYMVMSQKMWQEKSSMKQVKEESMQHMFINTTAQGRNSNMERKSISDIVYSPPIADFEPPLKVGKTWQNDANQIIHMKQMERMNGGSWKSSESNTTSKETIKYDVLSEEVVKTAAGSFNTLKVKEIRGNSQSDYTYIYYSDKGFPVKMEMYSNGNLTTSMELKSYNYQSESKSGGNSSSGGGLPGFEAIAFIGALSIAAYAYARRK